MKPDGLDEKKERSTRNIGGASSILNELLHGSNNHSAIKADVKTRGEHLVVSVINLIEDIKTQYDSDTAEMLERRLLAAMKSKDPRKFRFNKTNKNS